MTEIVRSLESTSACYLLSDDATNHLVMPRRKIRVLLAGWVNRQQEDVIDYLREENRVLLTGLRGKRLKLSDDDRRRLAVKAQALGAAKRWPRLRPLPHPRYASALVPPPHRSQVRWQQEPEPRADLRTATEGHQG